MAPLRRISRAASTMLLGTALLGALGAPRASRAAPREVPQGAKAPEALTSGLRILPGDFALWGPEARQRILVERVEGGVARGEAGGDIVLSSSAPEVVAIEGGVAVPLSDGEAVITAVGAAGSVSARVRAREVSAPFGWSFRNDVQPVLTKAGCNSGACHGALAGKNGFRLSLRGYDTERDHWSITRDARGRRVLLADPARSLVLLKPTAAVAHKGGKRLTVGSLEHRILSEWIADGAPGPQASDPGVEAIEVQPAEVVLAPGDPQQLIVRARYTNGRDRDVTSLAKFTANDASVATVDGLGLVTAQGVGEGSVTVWFSNQIVTSRVRVPYAEAIPEELYASAPRRNFIDELVLEKLRSLRVPPSPPTDDASFLRRLFLDTLGILPSVEEVKGFLADPSPDKRATAIEGVLERPELIDYWAYKWSDLLLVSSEKLPSAAMWSYHRWVRESVAANVPWDEFARRLVTATGSTLENGAASFYLLHQSPLEMAETTSVAFLGLSIQCARCHNHPMEKWTNDQYFGMVNLFARVRLKNGRSDADRFVFASSSGDVIQPLRGRPQPPRPLDGEAAALEAPGDRRIALAEWLTSPDNPYFARAVANRVWANFLGIGLVEPVDDLRASNPSSNEELLGALARHLVEKRYDLKALLRLILGSATYQQASAATARNATDGRFYSRYYPRRLMAEVILDALSQVTEAPTEFPGYPRGWRALQLPDSGVASRFLSAFGRPERKITCECERTEEPSMAQVLHLSNGETLNQKLAAPGNRLERLTAAGAPLEAIVEDLYLAALGRLPTAAESEALLAELRAAPAAERRSALEDLYWGVLTSTEFLFNH